MGGVDPAVVTVVVCIFRRRSGEQTMLASENKTRIYMANLILKR